MVTVVPDKDDGVVMTTIGAVPEASQGQVLGFCASFAGIWAWAHAGPGKHRPAVTLEFRMHFKITNEKERVLQRYMRIV